MNIRQRLDNAILPFKGRRLPQALDVIRVAVRSALQQHALYHKRPYYDIPEHEVVEFSSDRPGDLVIRWGKMSDWWLRQLRAADIHPDMPTESYADWRKRVTGNPDLKLSVSLDRGGVWWTVSIAAKSEDIQRPGAIWAKARTVEDALEALYKHPKAATLAHFRKERVLLVGASRKDAEKFAVKYPDAKTVAIGACVPLTGSQFDRIVYTPGADKIRRNFDIIDSRQSSDCVVEVAK